MLQLSVVVDVVSVVVDAVTAAVDVYENKKFWQTLQPQQNKITWDFWIYSIFLLFVLKQKKEA